ncbi:MAG TPA: porin family protein [Prolixibacteraceae bacterium]|jgi:opacity protein-like surface antigen
MKKLTIIVLLAMFALRGEAQEIFNFGLKAGINTSKISTHTSDYRAKAINNYLFGAFARINMGPLYLQPEAYFNSKGGEINTTDNASTVNSFNLNTIDVPALIGLKIINQQPLNVRIMVGPVFSFATKKSVEGSVFTKSNIENNFFGWQYGAGVDFLFLTLDLRMESHSDNLYRAPEFTTKNGNFIASLGVKF